MSMIRSACVKSNFHDCTFPRTPAELSLPDLLKLIMLVTLKDDATCWEQRLWNCTESNVDEIIKNAARALSNWPHGIRNFLRTVLLQGLDEPIRPAPIEGGKLIQALNSRGQAGLQWAGRRMVLEEVYRTVKGQHYVRLNPEVLLSHAEFDVPHLTTAEAAAMLGFHRPKMIRVARNNSIRKVTHWYRKPMFLYNKQDIEALSLKLISKTHFLRGFVSPKKASNILGIGWNSVTSLAQLGLLTSRSIHNTVLYSKHDALQIINKMDHLASGREPGEFDCRISAAATRWPWLSVAQLIKAVLDGGITITALHKSSDIAPKRQSCRGINAFLLASNEARAFAMSTRTHLTVRQAQEHMGIPQQSFYQLIEKGYLRTDDGLIPRTNRQPSISLVTINRFLALYTHTTELRRSLPPGTQVRGLLRSLGVVPKDEFSAHFGIYDRQTVAEALGWPEFLMR